MRCTVGVNERKIEISASFIRLYRMKPAIAKNDKERCNAWAKTTGARCRLARMDGLTCPLHVKYYDNWLSEHPPISGWRWNGAEFKHQVDNGFVHITNEYVAAIKNPPQPGHDYYSDFYEYLMCQPHIRPDVNPVMFETLIRQFCYLKATGSPIGPETMFANLFANPHFDAVQFLSVMASIFEKMLQPGHRWSTTRNTVSRILEQVLAHTAFDCLIYIDGMLPKLWSSVPPGSAVYHLLEPQLVVKRQIWYTMICSRMNEIKEEFTAVTWHPDRVMDWCFASDELSDFSKNVSLRASIPQQ